MNVTWSVLGMAVVASAALSAQSAADHGKPMMDGTTSKMMDGTTSKMMDGTTSKMMDGMTSKTFTGCVVAVNHGGTFLLTPFVEGAPMAMPADGMMAKESGAAMKDEQAGPVVLVGRSDLKKHVGQRVTVTGSVSHGMKGSMPDDRQTLTVQSLKVAAKSCS